METLPIVLSVGIASISVVTSLNNGLAVTPPLGWRSWNCYWFDINETLIKDAMSGLLDKSRQVNGKSTNLAEIGYNNGGIDDGWQHCNYYENLFHNNSAPNGWPVVNSTKFPSLESLINWAHNNSLGVNWYFNNCKCSEHEAYPANEENDVKWMRLMGLNGVKLDGCGSSMNTSNWNRLINITSPTEAILTEDGGNTYPPNTTNEIDCPMNMYNFLKGNGNSVNSINSVNYYEKYKSFLSNTNIKRNRLGKYVPEPSYPMLIDTLQGIIPFVEGYPDGYLSRPNCWAFPGDLQTGNFQMGTYGITDISILDQSIFSAWAIVSSPLVLGFDLTNKTTIDRVWNIITNNETLYVNQAWAGHPGRQIAYSNYTVSYNVPEIEIDGVNTVTAKLWGYEIWAKPLPNNEWAVVMLNNDDMNNKGVHNITVNFQDIPWNGPANVRDLINHKDLGQFTDSFTATNIPQFGSAFVLLSQP